MTLPAKLKDVRIFVGRVEIAPLIGEPVAGVSPLNAEASEYLPAPAAKCDSEEGPSE